MAVGQTGLCDQANRPDGSGPSSAIEDIDRIREQLKVKPTNESNLIDRRTALHRWWRLLWHQGYDMSEYDSTWNRINNGGTRPIALRAVDDGYKALESIVAGNKRIPEVTAELVAKGGKTNWPVYHGTNGCQTGYSPDKGPSLGKIAWRVPKGNFWNAKPVIEDGKVYVVSPGADVLAYCLDEKTGKLIWKGRQYGEQVYTTPGGIYTPVVTRDNVLITTGWWQPSTHFVLRKDNGFFKSRITPVDRNTGSTEEIMAFKYGRSNIAVADARTGEGAWISTLGGFVAGEPAVIDKRIYAAQQGGWVFGFLNPDENKATWQVNVKAKLRGTPGLGRSHVYVGDTNRTLHAIDAFHGDRKWTFQAAEIENKAYQYYSSAFEANNRVYVGTAAGHVYCLDADTGKMIWKHDVGDWVRSKPLVLGDAVHVATLGGKLHALRDTGDSATEVWQQQLGEHGFTADLVGNSNGILASGRNLVLYSVSPKTGDLRWRHSIIDGAWVDGVRHQADVYAGQFQSSPTIVDDIVYVGGPDGFLDAYDVDTGKLIWRFETQGRISCAPRVAEGKVFVGKNSHYDEYYALDKDTGEIVWQLDTLGWASVGATGYANGRIFVGTVDGKMYGINASNGKVEWKFDAGQNKGIYPHPATDDKKVYTRSHNGKHYAFDQATGDVVWEVHTANLSGGGGDPDSAATVLWKKHVYGQKRGDRIVALDRNTGEEAWEWKQPANYLQNGTVAAFDNKIFGSVVRLVITIPYYAAIHAFNDVEGGGNQLWSYSEGGGGGGLTAPVGTDGKLIFGSSSGVFVTCVDPNTGSLIWRCYVGGPMEESVPAIYGDKVFLQCRNGYFFAIE